MIEKNDVWIVTDSNSGITSLEGEKLNIGIVPMPFYIDDTEYLEGISIDRQEFYKALRDGRKVSTSQPSVSGLMDIFEKGLTYHKEILYIPMSSSLSGSCMTAKCLASGYDKRVQVADNLRISCTQKQSVLEAAFLAQKGMCAKDICEILERNKYNASIYIAVDTLQNLKTGGRMTGDEVNMALSLNIKPILQIQGGKIEYLSRARGTRSAEKKILESIAYDMTHKFFGRDVIIKGAYAGSKEKALLWQRTLSEYFPAHLISIDPLPLSICCHTGPEAIAAVCMEKIPEAPDVKYEI